MKRPEQDYLNYEIKYGNLILHFIQDAKDIICDCKNAGIPIHGLKAFTLSGRGLRAHEEHSLWFQEENTENWDKALAFLTLEEKHDFLYELFIKGIN